MPLNAAPLSAREFGSLMGRVGPFEATPRLAIGVSGGADSLALALLASEWARARGGEAVALTVDHGLRPESRQEARRVATWMKARRLPHRILCWSGAKPGTGLQAAARQARYELMTGWCRARGVLHLLVAHHMEDQAETFVLRLGRGSGADGLSCMSAVSEMPWVRLVRPLLGVPGARLRAGLVARGQAWIDDPSNRDPTFARVRIRTAMARLADEGLADEGLVADRLAAAAARLGHARNALEHQTARLLARRVRLFPAGYCIVDGAAFAAVPEDIGMRGLARILMCIGGQPYGPRRERLERLYGALAGGRLARPRTLGGCLVGPRRGAVLVSREAGAVAGRVPIVPGEETIWDRRFRVSIGRQWPKGQNKGQDGGRDGLALAALGRDGWTAVAAVAPEVRAPAVPAPARPTLPAIWDRDGIVAVPHLGYGRRSAGAGSLVVRTGFAPAHALAGAEFLVV